MGFHCHRVMNNDQKAQSNIRDGKLCMQDVA